MRSGAPAGSEVVAPGRRVNGYVAQDGLIEHRACDVDRTALRHTTRPCRIDATALRHMRHRVERACRMIDRVLQVVEAARRHALPQARRIGPG
jgi:hypothetical protein